MSSQLENSAAAALDALRVAAVTGQPSALRRVAAETVAQHEETLLSELLRLCGDSETAPALLNAAWKLLLSVATLPAASLTLHAEVLRFMLAQLHQHVFSHDWTDERRAKLAAFVASHIVSAARSQPQRMAGVMDLIAELYVHVCAAVAENAQTDAARRLHKAVAARLLVILAAASAGGALADILQHCVPMPASHSTSSAFSELSACLEYSSPAVAAVAAFAAMTTALRAALAANAPLGCAPEEMLRAALLWLPTMRHVILPRPRDCASAAAYALQQRVAAHAAALPAAVFYFTASSDAEEMPLDVQLLFALRTLATRCASLSFAATPCGAGEKGPQPLLRLRVFGELLSALLVPCDVSALRVLIVWDAALRGMPRHARATFATELCRLGCDQCEAISHAAHDTQNDKERAAQLRRFTQTLAVLLAAVCHGLYRSPSTFHTVKHSAGAAGTRSAQGNAFVCLANCMYAQTCAYQWWTDTAEDESASASNEIETSANEEIADEWAAGDVNKNDAAAQCAALVALPARIAHCARHPDKDRFISALRFATRAVQSALTADPEVRVDTDVTACARFVAAELVAASAPVFSDNSAFLACVRRLVDFSFDGVGDGLSRFHAAVCLRCFVQRNTAVPLASLCLSEEAVAALMQLLRSTHCAEDGERENKSQTETDSGDISAAECAGLWERHAKTFCPQTMDEEPPCEMRAEGFAAQLREAEATLEALQQWNTNGNALQPAELDAIGRLARLVDALRSAAHEKAQVRERIKEEPRKECEEQSDAAGGPEVFLVD